MDAQGVNIHTAYLMLGSNKNADRNLPAALDILRKSVHVIGCSSVWETPADGVEAPNFLNAAIVVSTNYPEFDLKVGILRKIELMLGRTQRERTTPTIDIDILLFDGLLIEADLFKKIHLIMPLAELLPEYADYKSGKTLAQASSQHPSASSIIKRSEIQLELFLTV